MTNDGNRMTNKIVGRGFSLAVEVLVLISMFCFLVSCSSFFCMSEQARTQKAQKEFLKYLDIVEKTETHKPADPNKFYDAVDFLEEVTDIRGHREHTYIGTTYIDFSVVREDFQQWKDWYEKNKDRLYWDERQKKIIVRER